MNNFLFGAAYGVVVYMIAIWFYIKTLPKRSNNMVNLNKLATKITKSEGGAKSLSIAQVKEVMKLTFKEMAKLSVTDLVGVLQKYK